MEIAWKCLGCSTEPAAAVVQQAVEERPPSEIDPSASKISDRALAIECRERVGSNQLESAYGLESRRDHAQGAIVHLPP
jgi:hypothetical protein